MKPHLFKSVHWVMALLLMVSCTKETQAESKEYSLEDNLELDEEKICHNVHNTSECKQLLEAAYIAHYPDLIERDGHTLSLKLDNGDWVEFEDHIPEDEVQVARYSLVSFQIDPGLYCVYKGLWEGGSFKVVVKKNGNQYDVLSEPVWSESHTKFACFHTDLDANYDPTGIQIWAMKSGKCVKEYEVMEGRNSKGEYWGAKKVEWVSEARLKVSKIAYNPETFAETDDGVTLLTFQNKKWLEF